MVLSFFFGVLGCLVFFGFFLMVEFRVRVGSLGFRV